MCELCDIFKDNNIQTKVYYKNDDMIILNCNKPENAIEAPFVIWQKHTMTLSPGDMLHIIKVLIALFGDGIHIRFEQKKIQDHLHWYVILDD